MYHFQTEITPGDHLDTPVEKEMLSKSPIFKLLVIIIIIIISSPGALLGE